MKKVGIIAFLLIILVVISNTDIVAHFSGQSSTYEKNVDAEAEGKVQEEKESLVDKIVSAVKGFILPPDDEELETVVVEADEEENKEVDKDKKVAQKAKREKPKHEDVDQTRKEAEADTSENDTQVEEDVQEEWQPEETEEVTYTEELIGTTAVSGAYTGSPEHNVQLACDLNNEVVIPPGGIYSAFDYLGDGGEDMGFEAAAGLLSDGTTVDMFGSGICTVTTAIFQAGRDAGLSIVEVSDHVGAESFYAAVGDQAMFNYPTNDLKMRNDYDYPVTLYMGYHDGVIYAEWYAQKSE